MRDLSKSEDTNFLKDSLKAGYKIYATDPYTFVYMRKKVEGFHTWDATDEQLLSNAVTLGPENPENYAGLRRKLLVCLVVGARPNFMKIAPIARNLRREV